MPYTTTTENCGALPEGWKKETREHYNAANSIKGKHKSIVYTYKNQTYNSKQELADAFSKITTNKSGVDLSSFDWKHGRWIRSHHKQKKGLEELSKQLFGKGITDINFTISQQQKMIEKSLPALKMKPVFKELTSNTKSTIRQNAPRREIIQYDFDYTRSEGINGTPIEQPAKKRMKQDNDMSPYGPLQVFGIKRLECTSNKLVNNKIAPAEIKCQKSDEILLKKIEELKSENDTSEQGSNQISQPDLPNGMNSRIIENSSENVSFDKKQKYEKITTDEGISIKVENPRFIKNDYTKLLEDDTLWKQVMLCLSFDGKPLPTNAIYGQHKEALDKIERHPDVFINALQPFVQKFEASKDVIAEQAMKVRKLRAALAEAQGEIADLERDLITICNEDCSDISVFGEAQLKRVKAEEEFIKRKKAEERAKLEVIEIDDSNGDPDSNGHSSNGVLSNGNAEVIAID